MHFIHPFSFLTFAATVYGQSYTSGGEVMVHVVHVGANGTLTFSPDDLQVNAGDMVQFQFYPKVIDEISFQNETWLSNVNPTESFSCPVSV
jgi:plastocyanin